MAKRTCKHCGDPIEGITFGRTPTYCSGRCRTAAYRQRRTEHLPARIHELDRWTAADGKRPVTPEGSPASSTDATTWRSYVEVKDHDHGVMLGGGLACIDLDGCLSPRGKLAPWAEEIIRAAPGAVVERSVSKRGLHVFGLLPETKGTRAGSAEIYSRARFIRTTEDIYRPGTLVDLAPTVARIRALHRAGAIPDHT